MPHSCSRCGVTCAGIPLARPAPDPKIEALLRTNLSPSEAQEAFFRETRRTGTSRLADLETRIADAQAKLDMLLQEHDGLVWNLWRCTDVLNPVRRLPSDVLCEIFAHSMTGDANSYCIYSYSGNSTRRKYSIPCQWRLGMVCMNWRHAVLNYPRLWSMIDLTSRLPSKFGYRYGRANLPTDNHPYFGAGRLLAMHICRSANHPLRVSLSGATPQSVLSILMSASYRWEHLCLDEDNLRTVESPLGALVSFRYVLNDPGVDAIPERILLLRSATSLRRLVIDNVHPVLHHNRVIIPWVQIRSVVVTGPLPDENATALIKLAPKLETVEFLNVNHSPLDLLNPYRPTPDSAHSASLESFSLNVKLPDTIPKSGTKYPSTVTVLFDSLTLPALDHLRIDFGGACGLSESIIRLLHRSQCALKRLALIRASRDDLEGLLGAGELQNLEGLLIEKLENSAHLQNDLELLTESAGLLRLRTIEIDASGIEDSIVACQDAVIQFMESRQVTNEGFGRLESLTLRAPASFEISEANVQRLEALGSLGTRFYIHRL